MAATTKQPASGSVLPAPDDKHEYVQTMFDAIAPRYDLLNSVLSARMHHGWRRTATRIAAVKPGDTALDVCTGTGDFAFELAKAVGDSGQVDATDFSEGMLRLGEQKAQARGKKNISWDLADTQNLPFADNTFDAVTVGFGIRNVADIPRGIREMTRVAKPGGRVVLLEFNQPTNPVFAKAYGWYSFTMLPFLGGLVSGRKAAYEYLPQSVAAFHSRDEITAMMENAGMEKVTVTDLTFGTVVIHCGVKARLESERS